MICGAMVLFRRDRSNHKLSILEAQFLTDQGDAESLVPDLARSVEEQFGHDVDEEGFSVLGLPMMIFTVADEPLKKSGSAANQLALILSRELGDQPVEVIPANGSLFWEDFHEIAA